MNKTVEYIKQHKKLFIIAAALIAAILIAVCLYGGRGAVKLTSQNDVRTDTEVKLMRILSEIEGVGASEVMVTEGEKGITGVVIVCEGANNIMTRNDVLNAVNTALGIEKSNIAIYAMNK